MRLYAKIFICGTLLFSLAFLFSGYYLMKYSYETNLDKEVNFALKQHQYDRFTIQSSFIDNTIDVNELEKTLGRIVSDSDNIMAFYHEDGTAIYSEINEVDEDFLNSLNVNNYTFQFVNSLKGAYIITGSKIKYSDKNISFITESNISDTLNQHQTLLKYFQRIYFLVLGVGMILMLVLSMLLTKTMKRLTKAAVRIAGGDYNERLKTSQRDEIGELVVSFNQMASAVEEKVNELSEVAKQKEDFVSNFAHELKTPLTSVIGYADMIYQKEMSRDEVKKAASYIWNEGMRLEALSLKLMELTVLNQHSFPLQVLCAKDILQDVADGLAMLLASKCIELYMHTEKAYIEVDYDLFKTMLINIIDNSIKADSSKIEILGQVVGLEYVISITDNGRGIPADELARITEAFYMVDKSRSRKQHGAGLGLALATKIAEIHETKLVYESQEKLGTTVRLSLKSKEVGTENEV